MRRTLGFTLIELLVTISIMAVIVGASLVAFSGTRASARDSKRKADIEALRSALELYRSDNGGYPTTAAGLTALTPSYIATIPPDPLAGLSYAYTSAATSTYTLCAAVENPSVLVAGCGSCGASATCSYKTTNP